MKRFFLSGILATLAVQVAEALIIGYAVLLKSSYTNEPFQVREWQPALSNLVILATIAAWFYFAAKLRPKEPQSR